MSKKNTYSFDINSRNFKTGSLTGSNKVARITDMETYELVSRGCNKALEEFMSARSDNMTKKFNMYKNISNYGYTYLNNLDDENHPSRGQAVTTINDYLKAAGLKSDL